MSDGPVTQRIEGCTLLYDLTQHRIDVIGPDGIMVRLRLWSLPDTPGGFDYENQQDHWIEVHNPNGVNFHPMHDMYEDNESLFSTK